MNYKECIQNSINFIEENLQKDFSLQEIADNCYTSYFHFSRIFRSVLGISMSDYVRRRRLSKAALELQKTDKNILEIAFDYQFNSQETFTRNFKKYFGITPGRYRKINENILLYEKTDFFMELNLNNIKGDVRMDVRVVKKPAMKLVGIEKAVNYKNTQNENHKIWSEFMSRNSEIKNMTDLDVYYEVLSDTSYQLTFNAFFGSEVSSIDSLPEGMILKEIPESSYLVFTHKGAVISEKGSLIKETYDYIYGKYIPNSEYELAGDFSFELYDKNKFKDPMNKDNEFDIYIPIK